MNLGLDIDGVLTNIEAFQFKYGIPYFKEKYQKNVVNENGKNMRQIFDCSKEEELNFWKENLIRYAIAEPAREDAAEYTKWAYENGHHIYIITCRIFATKQNFLGKLMRFIVKNWLKRNRIKYDEIIFCDEDKSEAIKKYDIKYMVDDDPDNIEALKDLTQIICMNAKCNEHIADSDVVRCHNFMEIIEYMKGCKNI